MIWFFFFAWTINCLTSNVNFLSAFSQLTSWLATAGKATASIIKLMVLFYCSALVSSFDSTPAKSYPPTPTSLHFPRDIYMQRSWKTTTTTTKTPLCQVFVCCNSHHNPLLSVFQGQCNWEYHRKCLLCHQVSIPPAEAQIVNNKTNSCGAIKKLKQTEGLFLMTRKPSHTLHMP